MAEKNHVPMLYSVRIIIKKTQNNVLWRKKSSVAEEMNDKEKVALLAKNTQGELVTVYSFSTHK